MYNIVLAILTYLDAGSNQLSGPPVDPGTYTVVATYAGDANHNGGTASDTITITL